MLPMPDVHATPQAIRYRYSLTIVYAPPNGNSNAGIAGMLYAEAVLEYP